jgi:hypothetical protein
MPNSETLTGLEDTLIEAARITIKKNGGEVPLPIREGTSEVSSSSPSPGGRGPGEDALVYRIPTEQPAHIEPLATQATQLETLRSQFGPQLKKDLAAPGVTGARAAYIAICLGETERFKRESPAEWSAAIAELEKYPAVVHDAIKSPAPVGDHFRRAIDSAGIHDPKNVKLTERPVQD